MKIKKQVKKRNWQILIITVFAIIIVLILLDLNNFVEGLKAGARAAQDSF